MKTKKVERRSSVGTVTTLLLTVIVVGGLSAAPILVSADRFDDQISQLRAENAQKQERVQLLQVEAGSLQETIAVLQAQINGLQAQIEANIAKNEELKVKIAEAEAELAKQKALLGKNIKAMYLEGEITTIEMLASSNDLSEFVDKQQYRNAVKDKIKTTVDKVTALKLLLKGQKEEVERLLKEQELLQQQISLQKSEQNRLLGLNQSEQSTVNKQIKDNQSKIVDLKRQQVLENVRLFGGGRMQAGIPGGGGYPWGNAYCVHTGRVDGDCYNYDWYFRGSAWDGWGYGFRNCTSWVAYKLAADGKTGISYLGNANEWPGRAAARGIPVTYGKGAKAGNAVVNPNGYYGHVMYVEAVLADGRIVVSDYNRGGDGLYRGPEGGNSAVLNQAGLVFIHF